MKNPAKHYDEGVLKALSNSTRREIIQLISDKGSASYSEMMHVLGFDPSLDSGTFNYHLKELAEAGLIEGMNGEYRISTLGKNALILIDQVRKEPQVDRYGVLTAAISMTPREELDLFKAQIGSGFGFVFSFFSIIAMWITMATANQLVFVISFVSFALSLGLTAKSINNLIQLARKYNLGLSVLLFISDSWFLLRSPNRGNFLALGGFTAISVFLSAIYLLLAGTGIIPWMSQVGVALLMISIFTAPFAFVLADTVIKKVEELESMENEQ
ncbi:MAG: winged helix-turn-helix domain-containing protein [Candidatus Thorarchaeota archaeon]